MALRAWMLLCLEILLCYVMITSAMSKKGAPPDTVGRRLQVEERVVSALRKSGRYRVASSLLDAIDINQVLPATCTLLIPDDSAASQLQFQNFTTALPVLQYHVLTQLLSFPDLLKLPIGSTLSTMLSGRPVLITNTSRRNFTLNDIRLSRPDLYLGDGLIVHGLEGILNFTDPISSSSHSPPSPPSSTPKPPSSPTSPPSTPSTPPPSPTPPPPPSMSIFSSPPPPPPTSSPPSPPTSSPPSPPIGSPPSPPTSSLPPIIFPGISPPPPPPPPPSPVDGPFTGPFDKNNMSQNFPFSSTASIPPCFPNSKMLILCSAILLLSTLFS